MADPARRACSRTQVPDPNRPASKPATVKSASSFIGNGDTPMVHHPQFVFNPEILPRGAAYWVALAEGYLG